MNRGVEVVDDWLDDHAGAVLEEFRAVCRLPNTSRDLPGVRAVAADLVRRFAERGVRLRAVHRPAAAPLLVGRIGSRSNTALGIYAHYDGQPVDPATWTHPPFAATVLDGPPGVGSPVGRDKTPRDTVDPDWRVVARGSADDRAPIVALLTALDALHAAGRSPTVDVTVVFEGEEEIGSPHLAAYLRDLRDDLAVDAWLICDGPLHSSGRPQVVLGVRGFAGLELTVLGPVREVHSGHYGNWAPNPAAALARLLASLKDDHGRVRVAGWDEDAAPVTDADRELLTALPDTRAEVLEDLALAAAETDERLEASLLRSSLNVRGLRSAEVGDDARNVIPARASASIDLRLAAGVDPAVALDQVESHLRDQGAHLVHGFATAEDRRSHPLVVEVRREPGYPGLRTAPDQPVVRRVRSALETAYGVAPIVQPTFGGSVPLHAFRTVLDAPVVITPIANHDNNQHAPDENLRVGALFDGARAFGALLHPERPAATPRGVRGPARSRRS